MSTWFSNIKGDSKNTLLTIHCNSKLAPTNSIFTIRMIATNPKIEISVSLYSCYSLAIRVI